MSHKVKMLIKNYPKVTSEISKTHKQNKYLYNMFVNHLGADFITRAIKGVFYSRHLYLAHHGSLRQAI